MTEKAKILLNKTLKEVDLARNIANATWQILPQIVSQLMIVHFGKEYMTNNINEFQEVMDALQRRIDFKFTIDDRRIETIADKIIEIAFKNNRKR
jgi:hypothetical protein